MRRLLAAVVAAVLFFVLAPMGLHYLPIPNVSWARDAAAWVTGRGLISPGPLPGTFRVMSPEEDEYYGR